MTPLFDTPVSPRSIVSSMLVPNSSEWIVTCTLPCPGPEMIERFSPVTVKVTVAPASPV